MAHLSYCYYVLLLLYILQESTAKDTWAIDCGGSESFTSTTNITWEPDDGYVHGGVVRTANNVSNGAYRNLRAFEAEKPARGCYTFPVGVGKKVLARASFYYGNYDGKADPPTFLLQFDATSWSTMETSMEDVYYDEIIYVTQTNTTSICVAKGRTGHTPFISTLQVAILRDDMYEAVNSTKAISIWDRVAFGASGRFIDKHFRYWVNTSLSLNISDYMILNNSATSFNSTDLSMPDDVPPEVLRAAITPSSAKSNITFTTTYLRSTSVPINYNMYFTEPVSLKVESSGNRSFNIFLDGEQIIFVGPVIPPYGSPREYWSAESTADNASVFELVPMDNATLPPVISAWELFVIKDVQSGTDSDDVNGLSSLRQQFEVLQDWAGDPCLPSTYNWEWLTCNLDPSPRVTAINLSSYGLSGELPDFSSLIALESIDLSNNNLTGDIPAFLGELPNLKLLNLADNHFSSLPSSLDIQNSSIQLDISGNPKLSIINQTRNAAPAPQPQPNGNQNLATYTNIHHIVSMFLVCVVCAVLQIA